ncbi:MAG TPA: hypothetical protein DEQ38_14370 [Elusimicrobia bacterium]|nr:MAG: hypothetical protein A2089_06915 [Elusimicrobia bacterium GWD2_63_28]HCC49280.1 hypothetical protein [Elusimicrobiota bacterium]
MKLLKDLFSRYPAAVAAGGTAVFAAAAGLYATLFTNLPSFDPKYAVYLDVANFYWIQLWADPGLFPKDPLAAWYLSRIQTFCTELPWIWVTSLFMRITPYTLGLRFLTALACAAGALLVFRLAARSAARPAITAVLFTVYFLSMDTFFGVPRVYGLLAFLAFLVAVEEKRFLLLPFLMVLSLLAYPIAALGAAFSALLVPLFFRADFADRRLLARYAAAMAAAGLLCVVAIWGSAAGEGIGRALQAGNGFEAYKLYQFVDRPLDTRNPLHLLAYFVLNLNEYGRLYPVMSALLALAAAAGALARPGWLFLPVSVKLSLAGALAAFAALYVLHPVSASRQTVFAVPLALVFLAADGLRRLGRGRLRTLAVAAPAALLFAALYLRLGLRESFRDYAPAYDYLAALPRDAVVAGHPRSRLLMGVPIFARRQAFLIDEHRDQYLMYLHGGADFDARRAALVSALYSATPDGACALGPAYGVTHIVMEDGNYSREYLDWAPTYPRETEISAIVAAAREPLGFYGHARKRAAFSWKSPRNSGLVFDLSECRKKGGIRLP